MIFLPYEFHSQFDRVIDVINYWLVFTKPCPKTEIERHTHFVRFVETSANDILLIRRILLHSLHYARSHTHITHTHVNTLHMGMSTKQNVMQLYILVNFPWLIKITRDHTNFYRSNECVCVRDCVSMHVVYISMSMRSFGKRNSFLHCNEENDKGEKQTHTRRESEREQQQNYDRSTSHCH